MSYMNHQNKEQTKLVHYLKFIIPSLLGAILFAFPISDHGNITIPIAVFTKYIQTLFEPYISTILIALMAISFFGGLIYKLIDQYSVRKNKEYKVLMYSYIESLFRTSNLWLIIRGISFFFVIIITKRVGVEKIYSDATGSMVFHDLLPILFSVFLLAGMFLPLLLEFGLLEFTGTLLQKVMKPVFGLPGRSAIDAIASWLGDGTIGVLLTSKQYEEGFYTEKEACVIGTSFSLVSITFSIVVIGQVGLSHMFVPFYLTVTFACIIAAFIVPKLPPLSRKKDLLIDGSKPKEQEVPKEMTGLSYGIQQAVCKAKHQNLFKTIFIDGVKNVLDMWIGVIPIVLAIGTIALMISEYTPIFRILGLPFLPILYLLQIPDAIAASQTLFAGFADMLIPSVMISGVESELTRFVIAAVSVSQLIYLSEVGALLIASKIPVTLKELFIIFIERTLITLPVIAVIAHMIF